MGQVTPTWVWVCMGLVTLKWVWSAPSGSGHPHLGLLTAWVCVHGSDHPSMGLGPVTLGMGLGLHGSCHPSMGLVTHIWVCAPLHGSGHPVVGVGLYGSDHP